MGKRQGPIAVLALLVTFLFTYAPAAQAELAGRASALAEPELVKAKSVRGAARGAGEAEADDVTGALPPVPVSATRALHAARPGAAGRSAPPARRAPLPYCARAPPAA